MLEGQRRLDEREADPAADAVGRGVLDAGERVDRGGLACVGGGLDGLLGGGAGDAPALEGRQDGPADLVDGLAAPGARPEADPADALAAVVVDDPELPR